MIERFNSLKISGRLLVGTLVTAFGLIFFASEVAYLDYKVAAEMRRSGELASLMPVVGGLVHELQKERGRSAGFISSRGRSFAESLPEQRQDTDRVSANTKSALAEFDFSDYPQSLAQSVEDSLKKLSVLGDSRSAVDRFEVTVPQMAKYYTGTIMSLLEIAHELELASHNDEISKAMISFLNFLKGKEYAGRERAMGAAGFGAGEFKQGVYNNLLRFVQSQDIYFASFKDLADPVEKEIATRTVSGTAVEEVDRMRKVAIASLRTGDLQGITAAHWFKTITEKIDLMKQVEDALAERMIGKVDGLRNGALFSLGMDAVLTILVLALSAAMVRIATRSVTVPIERLTDGMKRMSDGDHDIQIIDTDRRDELGVMARALQVFRQAAIDKIRMEQDAEAARQASEQEKQRVSDQLEHAVSQVGSALGRLAEGDLTAYIGADVAAEYEKTKQDFNAAAITLREALGAVANSANEIRTSSNEIAQASDDMSQRTESQAATLQQTAAAAAQIVDTVRATAEAASKAGDIVAVAKRKANDGSNVVGSAIQAMQNIEESAKKMNEIIGVIDEIAFQTNLLALNAGVEAARAGEAGRGFAVVASEVRALAQRSADESRQIKALISSSTASVGEGSELVRQTGEALEAIVAEVVEVDRMVGEISSGAKDQASSLEEVNIAVSQLDEVTQQNAAMAQQATAATRMLSEESNQLAKLVGRFVTEDNRQPSAADEVRQVA